ncbi:hypothetical protein POM88_047656 [Heracleum sosnowskyi]|uniref:Uncharacterized protein n=1 Tax=Heracleum sosnowskyi TaxID=360622 RepID=A0AAD8GUK5_9APIA|nr:hypothetical protein POM88_047656 [Heracleum sosnowskyi]
MTMGLNLLCSKSMKLCSQDIKNYVTSRNYYKLTAPGFTSSLNSYFQTCAYSHHSENREHVFEEHKVIKKGDVINLRDLLFTKYRDYVVRYEDNIEVQVKSVHLEGKVIVLYFLPLHHDYLYSRMSISYLADTYTYLLPDNVFEVVVVPYGTAEDYHVFSDRRPRPLPGADCGLGWDRTNKFLEKTFLTFK